MIINIVFAFVVSLLLLSSIYLYLIWFRLKLENHHLKEKARMLETIVESEQMKGEAFKKEISEVFCSISAKSLERNNNSFLTLAKETLGKFHEQSKGELEKKRESIDHLLKPMRESLAKLDEGIHEMEKERKGESEVLKAQISSISSTEKKLEKETSALVKALRMPHVRGRWGEMQLRRILELSGMVSHCDFIEQQQDGFSKMRPDVVVYMHGSRRFVIDAKTPCDAYLDAIHEEDPDAKIAKLRHHAKLLRGHISALGKKNYWEGFQPSPEFVVLFIPSDGFLSAALEGDPSLIEAGVEEGVVVATPTTLIGLLRAVAYGWKQEYLSVNAERISELAHNLYKHLSKMSAHWYRLGSSLSVSVKEYNCAMRELDKHILKPSMDLKSMGIRSSVEMKHPSQIDHIPNTMETP